MSTEASIPSWLIFYKTDAHQDIENTVERLFNGHHAAE